MINLQKSHLNSHLEQKYKTLRINLKKDDFAKFIVLNQNNEILIINHQNYFKIFTSQLNENRDIFSLINSISSWIKRPILNVFRIFRVKFSCTSLSQIQGSIYLIKLIGKQKQKIQFEHIWISSEFNIPNNMSILDKEIIRFVIKNIPSTNQQQPAGKTSIFRHKFHKKIISRIFYHLSSKKIRYAIFKQIFEWKLNSKGKYKIIDVSCGYDDLLIALSNHFKDSLIIGNDLIWQPLISIPHNSNSNNIIHTNHNILSPEFCRNQKYNLIICKNTLHHLSFQEQKCLIKKLIAAGKRLLIVEIENPINGYFRSYLWNFYYRHFLRDNGSKFLNRNQFRDLVVKSSDIPISCSFSSIKTIKGTYLIAAIEKFRGEIDW